MERYEKMMQSSIQPAKAESLTQPKVLPPKPIQEMAATDSASLQFVPDESQDYSNNDLINAAKTTVIVS